MNNNLHLKKVVDLFNKNLLNEALKLCEEYKGNKNQHIIKNIIGAIFLKQKKFDLAKDSFFKAIRLNEKFIDPYNNLYHLFNIIKDNQNLILVSKKIYEFDKKNSISNFKLGYAYEISGEYTQAINFYDKALKIGFKDKKLIYNNLGNVYLQLDKIDKSIQFFSLALENDKNNKIIINNLIKAELKNKDLIKIEELLHKAKEIDKNYYEFLINKADFFILKKRFNEAIDLLNNIITAAKNPNPNAYIMLCKIYFTKGEIEKGKKIINQITNLYPNNIDVIRFKGMRDLYDGDFESGWKNYELRISSMNNLYSEIPKWKGEELSKKRLLVYNEQGIGDCIQFSKYLLPLSKHCKNIDFIPNQKLKEIFSNDLNEINICNKNDLSIDKYNYKIPLGSLPKFFFREINKYNDNLILINSQKSEYFRNKIDKSKINIGLVWSGSINGPNEPYRSISLSKFDKILNLNANFYSIQNEIRKEDESYFNKSNIINYGDLLLSDIPSFINTLDLLITTDTSFLHFSGSIKKETWALLSLYPDWRWGKFYDLDPYTNMKIYKQKKFDNWDEVLNLVYDNLKKIINN